MAISLQKKLMFVPVAHVVIMFQWFGSYFKNTAKPSRFMKTLLKMFAVVLPIELLRIVLYKTFDFSHSTNTIIMLVSAYLNFVGFAYIAIKDQEYFLKNQ